jgi:hypothetical protein
MPLVDFGTFENTYSARIYADGSGISVTSESAPFIASVTRHGTGSYTVTWKSGFFGVAPVVVSSLLAPTGGNVEITEVEEVTTSKVDIEVWRDDAGATVNNAFDSSFFIMVQRQGSDYRQQPQPTAAVIKPSVCILKWVTGETANAASSSVGLNTLNITNAFGETWFVTGAWSSTNTNFELEAGQYLMEAYGPAMRSNYHHLRLYNTTDSTYDCEGSAEYNGSGDTVQTHSMIKHLFTITSSKTYQFKTYVAAAQSGDGLGVQASTSSPSGSIHLQCVIHKLK